MSCRISSGRRISGGRSDDYHQRNTVRFGKRGEFCVARAPVKRKGLRATRYKCNMFCCNKSDTKEESERFGARLRHVFVFVASSRTRVGAGLHLDRNISLLGFWSWVSMFLCACACIHVCVRVWR